MGTFSIWHWLIVLVIVMLLFGAGKIPKLMGDMAKGVKAFKSGLKEEEEQPKAETPREVTAEAIDATVKKDATKA